MEEIPKLIFKAYDVRGVYPTEINERIIARIAQAITGKLGAKRGRIVVGHDARLSSPALYNAVVTCLMSLVSGSRVIRAGLITTPMLYFLVNDFRAVGGIMVTASHNPKEYNGVKAVGPRAVPISGEEILKLVTRDPSTRLRASKKQETRE